MDCIDTTIRSPEDPLFNRENFGQICRFNNDVTQRLLLVAWQATQ